MQKYILIQTKYEFIIVDQYDPNFLKADTSFKKGIFNQDQKTLNSTTIDSPGVVYCFKDENGISEEKIAQCKITYASLLKTEEERIKELQIKDAKIEQTNFIIFVVVVIACLLILIGYIKSWETKTEISIYKKSVEISSLKSQSSVNGKFSIGRGFINEEDYYFFLAKDENGYVKCKAPSNITFLIEKDTVPTFTKYYQIRKVTNYEGFFKWKLNEKVEIDTVDYNYTFRNKYNGVLTIPKGTIEENQNYNVL